MQTTKPVTNDGYIVSPWYDQVFFITAPFLALLLGFLVQVTGANGVLLTATDSGGNLQRIALPVLLSSAFTHAHLVIVFFRSHGNANIFKLHPVRFVAVPIVLFVAALLSQWVFVILGVLVVWWDVYHSGMQTFGLGRLYDLRQGNDPTAARRIDMIFNLVVYVGPVLAGVNLWDHLRYFDRFATVDAAFLASLGEVVFARRGELNAIVLAVGLPFLLYYVWAYRQLVKQGYRLSRQKVAIFVATAVTSLLAWGYGSFGEAFLIMNFFHALQYFAILWWSEKHSMASLFRVKSLGKIALPLTLLLFLACGLGYGFWRVAEPHYPMAIIALSNVISVLHFWYDGFIWSVRKKQVT